MRKIRCNACGSENEVPDEGDLPRCEACDASLRTGTWLNEEADETDSGPEQTKEATANPDEAPPPPREPCSCADAGGPMPDDPTTCFLCGGVLPEPTDAPAAAVSPPAAEPEPKAISCSLLLADGRRIPVAEGILVARGDPASVTSPHIVNVSTPTVSRKHAWLRVHGQNVELVDLNSTNGTYIEGRRLKPLRPEEIEPTRNVQISFGRNLQATLEFNR